MLTHTFFQATVFFGRVIQKPLHGRREIPTLMEFQAYMAGGMIEIWMKMVYDFP